MDERGQTRCDCMDSPSFNSEMREWFEGWFLQFAKKAEEMNLCPKARRMVVGLLVVNADNTWGLGLSDMEAEAEHLYQQLVVGRGAD